MINLPKCNTKKILASTVIIGLIVLAVGCSSTSNKTELVYNVADMRANCIGVGPQKCYVIDNQLFYDPIENFDQQYREGCTYQIRVERRPSDLLNAQGQPPADASIYQYRLIEIISNSCN